ncbi:hypothetical protein GJV07_23725 [Enterobacteriaceae bacterium RIT711]|nr:hypothetical protein [Enterobacteriaceae bacterium RIT711]
MLYYTGEISADDYEKSKRKFSHKDSGGCWLLSVAWLKLMFNDGIIERDNLIKAANAAVIFREGIKKDENHYLTSNKLKARADIRLAKLDKVVLSGNSVLLTNAANFRLFENINLRRIDTNNKFQVAKFNEASNNGCDFLLFLYGLKRIGASGWFFENIETAIDSLFFAKNQKADGILIYIQYKGASGGHAVALYSPSFYKNGIRHPVGYMMGYDSNFGEFIFDIHSSSLWINKVASFKKEISAISFTYVQEMAFSH